MPTPNAEVLTWHWVLFASFVVVMLVLDLGVFHRKSHELRMREALAWCAFWIGLAFAFNVAVWHWFGFDKAKEFLAGYLLEESLSVDNLFVFLVIFSYFRVPPSFRHFVLFWGIVGAVVMRGGFIFGGLALIHAFEWVLYIFGGFLILTGVKLIFRSDDKVEPGRNLCLRLFRKIIPTVTEYEGARFLVRRGGRLHATPLLVVLIAVESTDIVFAVDSIPAVLGVTQDPFIVYTSNIFAILGLRAIFFVLAGMLDKFRYLKYGLGVILAFIGVKMILAESGTYEMTIDLSLGVVAAVLAISIATSMLHKPAPPPSLNESPALPAGKESSPSEGDGKAGA